MPAKDVPRPAHAEWISAKAWGEVCRAANVSPAFAQLPEDIVENLGEWQAMFDAVRVRACVGVSVGGGLSACVCTPGGAWCLCHGSGCCKGVRFSSPGTKAEPLM